MYQVISLNCICFNIRLPKIMNDQDKSHSLDEILRECTVHILLNNGQITGTGFFLAPKHVVTCAHVVEYAYGNNDNKEIQIFWKDHVFQSEIIHYHSKPYPDVAILQIDFSEHPCVYCDKTINIGDDLYSYGYPQDYSNGDSALFKYEGPTDSLSPLLKLKDSQACPGLSGAPLLNLKTGCVCGIVKSSRNPSTDAGGRAVPIEILNNLLSNLMELQKQFHDNNDFWIKEIAAAEKSSKFSIKFKANTRLSLEAIGYNVIEDYYIEDDLKVDLYAELKQTLHVHKLIVKCHYEPKLVDINNLRDFNSLIDTVSTRGNPISGLIVSNKGFTNASKKFAKKVNILNIARKGSKVISGF